MECRVSELRYKEIINVSDGSRYGWGFFRREFIRGPAASRYGWVGDVEVDLDSGQVRALVVPGRLRLFGLLGREEDRVFPWEAVRRFGADTILVETPPLSRLGKGN